MISVDGIAMSFSALMSVGRLPNRLSCALMSSLSSLSVLLYCASAASVLRMATNTGPQVSYAAFPMLFSSCVMAFSIRSFSSFSARLALSLASACLRCSYFFRLRAWFMSRSHLLYHISKIPVSQAMLLLYSACVSFSPFASSMASLLYSALVSPRSSKSSSFTSG